MADESQKLADIFFGVFYCIIDLALREDLSSSSLGMALGPRLQSLSTAQSNRQYHHCLSLYCYVIKPCKKILTVTKLIDDT